MKLPPHITISGYRIPVLLEPKVIDEKGNECYGWFDTEDYRIMLCEELDDRKMADALVHEVIEAVNYLADVNLPHNKIQTMGMLMSEALMPLLSGASDQSDRSGREAVVEAPLSQLDLDSI